MNYKPLLISLLVFGIFVLPSVALAQVATYKPLVGIPGMGNGEQDFGKYINALYALSISVAALMAVIKIIIAGVKYMLSDVVTSKSDAINDIRGSIIGLIVVISAVLILTVINPALKKTEIFIDPAKPTTPGATTDTLAAGTTQTGTGYKYALAGTVADFKATCEAGGGSPVRASLDSKPIDVCFDPLLPALAKEIDSTFAGTGVNVAALKKRFQQAHYPKAIGDTASIKAAEAPGEKGKVYLAVEFKQPLDWMDNSNSSVVSVTCREYALATGKKITQVGSEAKGYLACVSKD
jgi:hypothetical protein